MSEQQYPRAVVREVNGELVLDDPDTLAVIQAVGKVNCQKTLEMNSDRVQHFRQRIADRNLTPADVVIVVVNVDDIHGAELAEALMPGHNWQEIRDRGEVPFARGIATRQGIQGALEFFNKEAAKKLQEMVDVAVVVVDHQVAEVFPA